MSFADMRTYTRISDMVANMVWKRIVVGLWMAYSDDSDREAGKKAWLVRYINSDMGGMRRHIGTAQRRRINTLGHQKGQGCSVRNGAEDFVGLRDDVRARTNESPSRVGSDGGRRQPKRMLYVRAKSGEQMGSFF
jgi:hypothetical protein